MDPLVRHALQTDIALREASPSTYYGAIASAAVAAERLEISINTARTHLQRAFDKTGVHSQPALVRRLLSADTLRPNRQDCNRLSPRGLRDHMASYYRRPSRKVEHHQLGPRKIERSSLLDRAVQFEAGRRLGEDQLDRVGPP